MNAHVCGDTALGTGVYRVSGVDQGKSYQRRADSLIRAFIRTGRGCSLPGNRKGTAGIGCAPCAAAELLWHPLGGFRLESARNRALSIDGRDVSRSLEVGVTEG